MLILLPLVVLLLGKVLLIAHLLTVVALCTRLHLLLRRLLTRLLLIVCSDLLWIHDWLLRLLLHVGHVLVALGSCCFFCTAL